MHRPASGSGPERTVSDRAPGDRIAVMHVVDTLEVGGAERIAVNLVNCLPRDRFEPHLCATRRLGPLAELVRPDVALLRLDRTRRFDLGAVRTLVAHIRRHHVRILHAHGSAVFLAAITARLAGDVRVVWHVHYGRLATERQRGPLYRLVLPLVDHVVTVSQPLTAWVRVRLGVEGRRVSFIPNFVVSLASGATPELPGTPGARIVCVANLAPEKDHVTLVRAMAEVVTRRPDAHLVLVGAGANQEQGRRVRAELARLDLKGHVSLVGQRRDVADLLAACDIGVLSSFTEGLPLALLEYGEAGLPVVVTNVGQCPDVVGHDDGGLVVPSRDPSALAAALLRLLECPEGRARHGAALRRRVHQRFSAASTMRRVCGVYDRTTIRASFHDR